MSIQRPGLLQLRACHDHTVLFPTGCSMPCAQNAAARRGSLSADSRMAKYDFSGEKIHWEGPPHRGDIAVNVALGTTLLWLPLTIASVTRGAFVNFIFSDKRLSVITTAPWKSKPYGCVPLTCHCKAAEAAASTLQCLATSPGHPEGNGLQRSTACTGMHSCGGQSCHVGLYWSGKTSTQPLCPQTDVRCILPKVKCRLSQDALMSALCVAQLSAWMQLTRRLRM